MAPTSAPPGGAGIGQGAARLAIVGVAALAFAAYANSLGNGFVWDDPIILNRQLVAFDSLSDVLFTPRGIPQYSPDYYRPLIIVSFLLDRALGGAQPLMFHLSVVLMHVAAAALVCGFGLQLLDRGKGAVAGAITAGALFATHPIHTESVAWIAGRSDVLATALLLAALVVHGRGPASWSRSAATGGCVLAALGAKENAIAVLPLLLLYDVLASGERRTRSADARVWLRRYAGPIAATAIYLLLRRAALGDFIGHAAGTATVRRSLRDLVGAIGAYGLKLAWPVGLNAYIDTVPTGAGFLALTVVAVAGGIGACVWWWRHAERVPAFLVLWVGLTLGPSLPVVWRIPDAPMAERYLYLPSVGFCLLAGYGVKQLLQARRASVPAGIVMTGAALMVIAATIGTIRRNRIWHDDVSLWEDTAEKSQTAGLPIRSLGTAYQQRGRVDDARRCFELALQRRNSPSGVQIAYNNLGTLAMQEKDYARATAYYQRALDANPNAADTLFNLGLAMLQAGGASSDAANDALRFLQRAQELSPHDPDIEAALGQVYAIKGERERAVEHLKRALQLGASPATAASIQAYLAGLERK